MNGRLHSPAILLVVGLFVALTARQAAGQALKGQIDALVQEFIAEQQTADAALAAGFSKDAVGLAQAKVAQASSKVSTGIDELCARIQQTVEDGLTNPKAGWGPARSRNLASSVQAAIAASQSQFQQLGVAAQAQLAAELQDLAKQYIARRNQEVPARIREYIGRLKALIQADADARAAIAKGQVSQSVNDFGAKLRAGLENARAAAAAKAAATPKRSVPAWHPRGR